MTPAEPPPATPRTALRPRVWTVFLALSIALCSNLCLGVFTALAALAASYFERGALDVEALQELLTDPTWVLAPTLLLTALLSIGIALAAAYLSPLPLRRRLALVAPVRRFGWLSLPLALGGIAVGIAAGTLCDAIGVPGSANESLNDAVAVADPLTLVVLALGVAIGAPVAEELLFRGYAQQRLVERWGAVTGIVVTSVLFGLFHIDPSQALPAIAIGGWLGWLRHRSGSLWLPFAAHATNNFLFVVFARLEVPDPEGALSWALAGGGLLVAAALVFHVERGVTRDAPGI